MTVRATQLIHFDADDLSHKFHPGDSERDSYGTLGIGAPIGDTGAYLFFDDTDAIDAAIRELAALKAEMLGGQDEDPPDRARKIVDDRELGHIAIEGTAQ